MATERKARTRPVVGKLSDPGGKAVANRKGPMTQTTTTPDRGPIFIPPNINPSITRTTPDNSAQNSANRLRQQSLHDGLCIRTQEAKEKGLQFCWCICTRCFRRDGTCICSACACRAARWLI